MKARSFPQPIASLIVLGHMPVANSAWPVDHRGEILVHASRRFDDAAFREQKRRGITIPAMPLGCIIGMVEIVDCVTEHPSDWFAGPYGLVLRNARPLRQVQLKGQPGLFDVPEHLLPLLGLAQPEAKAA